MVHTKSPPIVIELNFRAKTLITSQTDTLLGHYCETYSRFTIAGDVGRSNRLLTKSS